MDCLYGGAETLRYITKWDPTWFTLRRHSQEFITKRGRLIADQCLGIRV
jgi:hypothetical protein